MSKPTLHQTIESHNNNYTWLRLILSASIIYYHSFGLVWQSNYVDHLTYWLQPVTTVGGLTVQSFFFLSGLFVAQSYHRDPNLAHFAIKRVLRIWQVSLYALLQLLLLRSVLPNFWKIQVILISRQFPTTYSKHRFLNLSGR